MASPSGDARGCQSNPISGACAETILGTFSLGGYPIVVMNLQRPNRRVAWTLIVAVLNLLLLTGPSGMVLAGPLQGQHVARDRQATPDHPPCHGEQGMTDQQQAATPCSSGACADGCGHCLHIGMAIAQTSVSARVIAWPLPALAPPPGPSGITHAPIPHPPRPFHS